MDLMKVFYDATLDVTLPFTIEDDDLKGLVLISKTNSTNKILEKVYGWAQVIPVQVISSSPVGSLEKDPSIIKSVDEYLKVWGLISLVSNDCEAPIAFQTDPSSNPPVVKEVLGTIIKRRPSQEPGRRYLEWKTAIGEEIVMWYCEDFTDCCCKSCSKDTE
jgi:hypothetical protein